MTDWQRGYADAYVRPGLRKYPALPDNADYMDGYMEGQRQWRISREGKDMGHFRVA